MSGSSLDGVDLVLVSFCPRQSQHWGWEILKAITVPYTQDIIEQLRSLHTLSLSQFFEFEVQYSKFLATIISDFIGGSEESISVVGIHGHTFLHNPRCGYSIQLGNGEIISAYLGVPVVTEFRTRLIAFGGEGAPLVPHAEPFLFPSYLLFLNLGGIANLSLHSHNLAFDFHACNQVLNSLACEYDPSLSYDPDGRIARTGTYSSEFAHFLHEWDFLKISPPKSLSNEKVEQWIQEILAYPALSLPDKMHTFVIHFADELVTLFTKYDVQDDILFVTGGGALNTFLIEVLKGKLASLSIKVEVPNPIVVKYKEAVCFAYFAVNVLCRMPWTLSNFTPQNRRECAGSYHHTFHHNCQ